MSVLIKGMKMPKCCDECDFVQYGGEDWCYITEQDLPCDCPLIELPDHGDLVDRDALIDVLYHGSKKISEIQMGVKDEKTISYCQGIMVGYSNSRIALEDAPVVIPAERSEDE